MRLSETRWVVWPWILEMWSVFPEAVSDPEEEVNQRVNTAPPPFLVASFP